MESQFKSMFSGPRWRLLIPAFGGDFTQGVIELQRVLQKFLPYVLPLDVAEKIPEKSPGHLAIAGTLKDPLILDLVKKGVISQPEGPEGFSIFLGPAPWNADLRLLVVAGNEAAGVLYGSQEVAARLSLEGHALDGFSSQHKFLDQCPPFFVTEKPVIERRGIWTWGYVIYSYRVFLDKMTRLKLNTLIIWNDRVPLNIREVIAYAHARNIRVILGFHCGWGHKDSLDLSNAADRATIVHNVVQTYREQYADIAHDGIYLQTLTEHGDRNLAGASTASWVCQLINATNRALQGEWPGLRVEFGIHGTSIGDDDKDLADVDPEVELVWEDCGSVPYAYSAGQVEIFESTLAWSRRLAALRPNNEFSMVAKGWMQLRWEVDFENHENFILGERSREWIRRRLEARQSEWDQANWHWLQHFPKAAAFYREMLAVNPRLTITGLVEDGMLEENVPVSVALFAETLWNPYAGDAELLARASRPFLNH